tara:strand:- start:2801 stop:3685 length:885 start_codon:yes stop_codon:yes gene_type:complete
MKLGIFADGKWGLFFLKKIIKNKSFKVKFICGRANSDHSIKKIALNNKKPFFKFKNIKSNYAFNKIKSFDTDLLVSMSYDQIFDKKLITLCKIKPINCHAGMLPKYRGRNVINWAIINGEKKIGITVHFIDNKIDTGNIIDQKILKISINDDYNSILNKCYLECPKLLMKSLKKLLKKNNIKGIVQKKIGKGFYCKKRVKGDEIIDLNNKTKYLNNFIRALTFPGPNARFQKGKNKISFIKSQILEKKRISNEYKIGQIINFNGKYFDIKTQDGAIRILKWKTNTKLFKGLVLR